MGHSPGPGYDTLVMFCVKSESWDMWPVCEVTCKIQINSDNSLSSVTQRSSALPGGYELIIYLAGEWYIRIVRSSWYLCSGHSGKCHGPPSIAQGLMNRQIPGSIHFDDDDLIRFRGGLIMPSHLRYHCRHAGTMITMYNVLRLISNCVIACTAKKREMLATDLMKNNKTHSDTDSLTNTWFEIPWCFSLPMMKDGDDCLYSVQLYGASGDVNELLRIFLFLKARTYVGRDWPGIFWFFLSFFLGLLEVAVIIREPLSIFREY